jgi:hypothetical protein
VRDKVVRVAVAVQILSLIELIDREGDASTIGNGCVEASTRQAEVGQRASLGVIDVQNGIGRIAVTIQVGEPFQGPEREHPALQKWGIEVEAGVQAEIAHFTRDRIEDMHDGVIEVTVAVEIAALSRFQYRECRRAAVEQHALGRGQPKIEVARAALREFRRL